MAQSQRGKATFYSKRATGARTASGERLHHDSMTCAHRTFAFGTLLRVTNLSNRKEVIVRVTDRGPFAKGRIIDLSWGAAKELGILSQGVAMVTVERVDTTAVPIPYRPKEPKELPELDFGTVSNGGAMFDQWTKLQEERTKQVQRQAILKKKLNLTTSKDTETTEYNPVKGAQLVARIPAPPGYKRVEVAEKSFAHFLRNLPLKPAGSDLHYYNGQVKKAKYAGAIVDMDFGGRENEQCADAVIFLRASYLWQTKQYAKIHFRFTNGFKAEYAKWAQGYRIRNNNAWTKTRKEDYSYATFRNYLNTVFQYAGTASLSNELTPIGHCWAADIQAGDVIIKGGFPGHAEMVVDVVENEKGHRKVLLAQSFMPAQEIEIFPDWVSASAGGRLLVTPSWTFDARNGNVYLLRRFKAE